MKCTISTWTPQVSPTAIASSTASRTLFELVAQVREVAGVVPLEHMAERDHLGRLRIGARRGEQPGRQAERTGGEPLLQQRDHLRKLGRRGRALLHAHDHQAQRVVPDQHAGVHRGRRKGVEIVGKRRLAERQPRRARAQVIAQQLDLAGQHRRDREPAMADDLGRHALAHLALGLGIDRQREVGMGLDVDEAGRDREPGGVDHLGRVAGRHVADRRDPSVANGKVAGHARAAAAVEQQAAADQNVRVARHGGATILERSERGEISMHKIAIPKSVVERVIARHGSEHVHAELDPKKTALVVVDMQNAFMMPGVAHAPCPMAIEIVPNINRLAQAVRDSGGTVIWIKTTFTEETLESWSSLYGMVGPQRTAKRAEALTFDSKGHELWAELDVRPEDHIVEKLRFSAFIQGSSNLAEFLRVRGLDTVLITGTVTNVCCESTARDAMMLNFKTVMVHRRQCRGDRRGPQRVVVGVLSDLRRHHADGYAHLAAQAERATRDGRGGVAICNRRAAYSAILSSSILRSAGYAHSASKTRVSVL